MDLSLPVIAGAISTAIFAASTLPMLWKARRSKDLSSYSLGNMLLANAGNVVYSIYVFDLPKGPLWVMHSYYLVTTALMLFWYVRYTPKGRRCAQLPMSPAAPEMGTSPDAVESPVLVASEAVHPGVRRAS
jgi:uncharacterized protein with PQ loop repeat